MNIPLEKKSRRSHSSVLIALFGSLVVLGCGQGQTQQKQGPLEVSVVKVEAQDVTIYTDFVGTVDGIENAEIRARVAGYVEAAHFAEGSRVKAGDLLFTIDPVLSEAEVRKARGDVAMAQASAAKSKADVDRLTPLVATNSVSRQELDHATAAYQGAEAQILAAQGALATAQASLDFTKVRSPIDGVVGVRQVSIGSLVGQGEPTLLTTVSQLDPVRVRFPVSEQLYLKHATALNTLVDRGPEPNAVEADGAKQDKDAKAKPPAPQA
ncbi:MAG TPA: efflux RND transporter periplasmic adaptor subunit, partial [Polyangiaceae bacterium]|nr:efflux RND transporter periplasmic adaptor subunit [Polyangiaceae bacterium]